MDRKEQCVLITGASKGIGAELAAAFARGGYGKIGVNYVKDKEGAEAVAAKVVQEGAEVELIQADVSIRDENEGMIDRFLNRFGRIDVLVNNAGGALAIPDGGFIDMPLDYWDGQIALNLNAAAYSCHRTLKNMIDNNIKGRIINISSIHASITWVKRKTLPYTAAKAGLEMFTKALAVEVARYGININAVAPGFILTKATTRYTEKEIAAFIRKIPLGRLGTPSDVAPLVLFLADETASKFIVGQTFTVDGGQSIDGVLDDTVPR
jgi:NAD(P)-dependent dehydrogenase (short-subunit alcohol dehydrogenase family)